MVGDACYKLDTIELAAFYVTGTNALLVKVLEDNAGLPGSELESFSFTNLNGSGSILLDTSLLNPELSASTKYWLAAFPGPDTRAAWNDNSIGDTTPGACSTDGGVNWNSRGDNQSAGAFRITGTKCSENPVPEPSGLLALMSGLPMAGFLLRRKRS